MQEAEINEPEVTVDSEQHSLPLQGPAIESARNLFTPEEVDNDEVDDLEKIIGSCLKDAKGQNTRYAIKSLSHLIAVSEYVKLRARYRNTKACKRPCLSASIAIARRMGKGPYFARQIRHNELYLLRHRQLPPPKSFVRHGHHTLLDNETVLHNVRMYLASQALGTVTPRIFCRHTNEVILPTLGIDTTITESTAQRWLRLKLGYQCKEAKKGIYIDGHERPDVIKEREEFIDQIFNRFEWYVAACIRCSECLVSYFCLIQVGWPLMTTSLLSASHLPSSWERRNMY